jgi:hypothetical protein
MLNAIGIVVNFLYGAIIGIALSFYIGSGVSL